MFIVFLILAALVVFGTAAAISLKNLVHCVLALMLGLLALALLYLQLGAEFAGFTQIIVYVGAVAILAMFAIMMTRGAGDGETPRKQGGSVLAQRASGLAIAFFVFYLLSWCFTRGIAPQAAQGVPPPATVQQIGDALMHRFTVPFEIVGLLLTAALIGAGVLALDESAGSK